MFFRLWLYQVKSIKRHVEHLLILAFTITGCGSYICHDEFVPVNNVLREYNNLEVEIKISVGHTK